MSKVIDSIKALVKGPSPSTAQPKQDQDLTTWITEKWVDLKSAYWMKNSWIWGALLMYVGELWLEYSIDRRLYQRQVPKDDFVPTPRINKFAPTIDAIAANFSQVPEVEAVPTPIDDVDKMVISEVCNELAQHFIKEAGLRADFQDQQSKVSLAGQLFVLAGGFMTNVYVHKDKIGEKPVMVDMSAFDAQCPTCDTYQTGLPEQQQICPTCGNPVISNPVTVQAPQMDENGQPMTEDVTEPLICCDIENQLYLYPRPGAKNMDNVGWFFIAERLGLDDIWSKYGIEAQQDSEYPDGWNTTNENALNFFYLGYSNYALSAKDGALVIRAYCEPGKIKDFPDGFIATYINGKVQKMDPWPKDEHPLTKFDYKSVPTLIFPRSVAFDLVALQKEKCDLWSAFVLHAKTTACDPWIIDKDAQVSEITGRGDKKILYRKLSPDTQAPHHAGHGSMDPQLYELDNKLDAYFDEIGQTAAVWRGEQPGSVKAGVALETLRSQAEFMFSGPSANWNNGWKETVRKGVKLMQTHYTLPQIVEIVGDNRMDDILAFQQCDLDDCVEWIASKSGMPRTRSERRAEMIQLYDAGALDINDPEVKQKIFELFGETGILTTFNKDAKRARWENAQMKAGGDPVFMPEVDDNQVHLDIHGDDIKSQDFLKRPPEIQQKAVMHYMAHKQVLAAQAAQAAMNAMPIKPAATPNQEVQPK